MHRIKDLYFKNFENVLYLHDDKWNATTGSLRATNKN